MKIHQNDLGDILNFLPVENEFNPETQSDFLICTLGFEERTYAVAEKLVRNNPSNHKSIILVTYPTNREDNNVNRPHFEELKSKGINIFEIGYEKSSFYNSFAQLLIEKVVKDSKIIFDISTCSSYIFYPIIKSLLESDIQLTIAYTEANLYDPTEEEWRIVAEKAESEHELFVKSWDEADFQSIGVDEIYSSNLFTEMNSGNKPSILVAIPNFNSIRMQSIKEKDKEINKTDAKKIIWLVGMPPSQDKKWRADALIKTYALESIKEINKYYVSTLHYKETLQQLEAIWITNRYTDHISIGSLGSKMQHLGTFFFVYLHPDTGLWLAEPLKFKAKSYSKGIGKSHQIDYGSTKLLKEKLSKYMHFSYEF